MRPLFRRRTPAWRSSLAFVASVLFLFLLFVSAKDEENLLFVQEWRPEIEPLLLIGVIALLSLAGRQLAAGVRWLLAGVIFLAALLQFADAMVLSIFDRALDLYFDLPHVPSLIGLFYEAAGPWRGAAAILGSALAAAAVVALIAAALGAIGRALEPRTNAWLCLGLVLLALAALPVAGLAGLEAPLGWRTSPAVGEQLARVYRAFAVTHGFDERYAAVLGAPQPAATTLPGLKHQDVYLVFFESFGTVALDDKRYAPTVLPALDDFSQRVGDSGYGLVSTRVVSPTFGGGSWLAHGTMDSGVKLDPLLTRLITASRRESLPRYMHAAGYRSIAVMPGLKGAEPEQGFWGFDRSYRAADLGYDGPPFGWFDIPDQWTLRRLDETEGAPGHKPLFAQIVLVSSHTPFVPVPPYVADWSGGDLYRNVPQADWDRIYAPPDWSHLDRAYAESVVYDLRTLGAWLARLPGDALVIILGDHQPPGFISGQKQPWTVPIYALSRDPDLLQPFRAVGYVEGAVPPPLPAAKGMESFLGDFLQGFAVPAATARRDALEPIPY
jgi:hypothetical protein